jgi:hypothetical protein
MRAAAEVAVGRVVKGPDTAAARIGQAHARRDPVRAGKGPEVGIEGAVLLHDHDHVLDLVNARGNRGGRSSPRRRLRTLGKFAGEYAERKRENQSEQANPLQAP